MYKRQAIDKDKIAADVAGTGLTQAADGSLEVDVSAIAGDGSITSPNSSVTLTGTPANSLLENVGFDVNVDDTTVEVDATNGVQIKDDGIVKEKINPDVAGTGLTQAADGSLEVDVSAIAGDGSITSPNSSVTLTGTPANSLLENVGFDVNVDDTTVEVDATNGVQVKDDGITTAKIAGAGADQVLTTDASGDPQWEDKDDLNHTGTAGSVFFASSADGTPTENNDQFYYDEANTRLFIGPRPVNNINNELNVGGTTRTSGLNNSDGTAGRPSYRFTDDSNTGLYRPGTDRLAFSTGGTQALQIESDGEFIMEPYGAENASFIDDKEPQGGLAVESNGNVVLVPVIYATGKVRGDGTLLAGYNAAVSQVDTGDYRITFQDTSATPIPIGNDNYIIQLTILDCGGDCPPPGGSNYDDPGITYYGQDGNGFNVNIGDNDNGDNPRIDIDQEFMFTVIRLPGTGF